MDRLRCYKLAVRRQLWVKFGGQDASARDPLHLSLPTRSILCESGPGSVGELRNDASVISGLRRNSPPLGPAGDGEEVAMSRRRPVAVYGPFDPLILSLSGVRCRTREMFGREFGL